jgi:hypothetical protein
MDSSLRYLAPDDHDRVRKLLERYPCEYPNISNHIQLSKIFRDPKKYSELLEKIELFAIRKAGFNFVIKNVPEWAELRDSRNTVRVGLEEMRDTLELFGSVKKIDMVRDTVYSHLDDPDPCHKLINNMLLGENIIRTLKIGTHT